MSSRLFYPALILCSSIAVTVLNFGQVDSPLRVPVALWFLLAVPGLALVRLLRIDGPITEWTLAIAVSIALDTAVATVMIYAQAWSPNRGLMALVVIAAIGALFQLPSRSRPATARQRLP